MGMKSTFKFLTTKKIEPSKLNSIDIYYIKLKHAFEKLAYEMKRSLSKKLNDLDR